jgi:ABC-type Fe3+-hydroxamate transport system substrate-binding protein
MRVVSLCPSTTELVFELGAGSDLVAVTKFCVHPKQGVSGLVKVGGTKTPDLDAIQRLAPDLVLLNREENRAEDAAELERRGISCRVSFPKTVLDCAAEIVELGRVLGRDGRAAELAAALRRTLAELGGDAGGNQRPVRFAYLIWVNPWMTVNRDTYVSSRLETVGGHNAFGACAQRYPAVSAAELDDASPEAVLLSSEPFPFRPAHRDALCAATGLAPGRFHFVDGELLSWHGARTESGLRYAARLFELVRSGASG